MYIGIWDKFEKQLNKNYLEISHGWNFFSKMLTNVRRSLVYVSTVYATTRRAVTTAYAPFRATIWVQTEPVASVSIY